MNNTTVPPQSEEFTTRLIYGIALTAILILGLVGHILTLFVLLHRDHRRKIVTPYLVNLSLNNLCMIVFGCPVSINAVLRHGIGINTTKHLCVYYGYMEAVTETASVLSLMALSIVLYWAINHQKDQPISGKRLSRRTLVLSLGGIWVLSFVICVPPIIGWSYFEEVNFQMTCHLVLSSDNMESVSYAIFMLVVAFFIPLVTTCVFFHRTYRRIQLLPRNNTNDQAGLHRTREQTVIRMIILVVIAFILSWTPYYITTFISIGYGEDTLSVAGHLSSDILTKSSVVYNPIIFTASNSGFRATLLQRLGCRSIHPEIMPYNVSHQTTPGGRRELEVMPAQNTSSSNNSP